ncbi:MAG TPA: CBS domain-containing protein [Gemmataceae bacterium]|nr:CBS domain-containing protein [Gemmataceae bacterium]
MKTIEKFVKRVVTAMPQETLAAVARLMEQHNVGAVVLAENHRPVGIVTDRDLALHIAAHGVPLQAPAARVMSTPVMTVGRDDGVFDTTQSMMESGVRRLPVVDEDGRLVGLVTLDDLLRVLGRELSNLLDGIRSEMAVK